MNKSDPSSQKKMVNWSSAINNIYITLYRVIRHTWARSAKHQLRTTCLHMHYGWPSSLPMSPPTQLMSPDACGMSRKNSSWLPHGLYKNIQPWVVEKASCTPAMKWADRRMDLRRKQGMRVDWREAEDEQEKQFCILSAGCLWSVGQGRRATTYGAHLAGRAALDLARWSQWPMEKDAQGRTRALHKGSTNCAFKQQPWALQSL